MKNYKKLIVVGVYTGIRKHFSEMAFAKTKYRIQPYVGVRLGLNF